MPNDRPAPESARSKFGRTVAAAAIGVVVSAVVSYWIWRPEAEARFYCEPYEGAAPLAVRCVNESQYARKVMWDFGDGTPARFDDEVLHVYPVAKDKPYVINLTAFGKGRNAKYPREVNVREAQMLAGPIAVSLKAEMIPASTVTKVCPVDLVNDEHPKTFSPYRKQMTSAACVADDGYVIQSADLVRKSDTRADDVAVQIAPDRRSASVSAALSSGPAVDRYRGWLRGELIVTQARTSDGSNSVKLADGLQLVALKEFPLDRDIRLASIGKLSVEWASGQKDVTASEAMSGFTIPGVDGVATLAEGARGLELRLTKVSDR